MEGRNETDDGGKGGKAVGLSSSHADSYVAICAITLIESQAQTGVT